ncbi:protein of unknown function [Paraburkholderia kururiensis]
MLRRSWYIVERVVYCCIMRRARALSMQGRQVLNPCKNAGIGRKTLWEQGLRAAARAMACARGPG